MREGWVIRQVKEICDKASSNIAQKEIAGLSGDYPVYGASGYVQNVDFFHRDKPYIGIVKDGSGVGRVNTYPAKTSLLGTLQYIIPKDGYSLGYVAYLLKSLNLAKFAAGAAIPHIYFKDYGECKVSVPPIVEQEKIVAELDCLTGIIEKKKQQLEELDKLAQSIFYDMFGDPITNEKGWPVKKLGDVGKVITGNTPTTKDAENYSSNDYCFIKPGDIGKDAVEIIEETEAHISTKAYLSSRRLPIGSVLITCIGIVGKVGITSKEATCNQQINAILPNSAMSSTYVANAILLCRKVLETMANAPVVPIINKGEFSSICIPFPPLDLQNTFAQKIGTIEKQKELIKKSIQETETLFNSRMDYWFN